MRDKLESEITSYKLLKKSGVDNINVLLVGEVSAGKSSFINSVESVFTGHVTNRANSGITEKSLTTQVRILIRTEKLFSVSTIHYQCT